MALTAGSRANRNVRHFTPRQTAGLLTTIMKKTMALFAAGMILAGAAVEQPALAAKNKKKGSVKKEAFGKTEDGKKVDAYILTNKTG